MIAAIQSKLLNKYHTWLDSRHPVSQTITLAQRNIYIVPNKLGLLYLLLILVLFVTAINYQNNLIFSFSILLLSILLTTIVSTYQNISGLKITVSKVSSVFCGEATNLMLHFHHDKKTSKRGLYVGFDRVNSAEIAEVQSTQSHSLSFVTSQRGPLHTPRLTVFCQYPLGLLTTWSWFRLHFDALVYPAPIILPFNQQFYDETDHDNAVSVKAHLEGGDDFDSLRNYQVGDSLSKIAWAKFAKTQTLLVKTFEHQASGNWAFNWDDLQSQSVEYKLSVLCGWVLQAHELQQPYSLSIPGKTCSLNLGEAHFVNCLSALAMYGFDDE